MESGEGKIKVEGIFENQKKWLTLSLDHFKKNWKNMLGINYWVVRDFWQLVEYVNEMEEHMMSLSDGQLKEKTLEFKKRLSNGESLDDIQAEAFAVVREAARRTLGMRHFDVQIIGGGVLHAGAVAEMQTGEGKTLVATLAAYLNALPGEGVHVVTVNDYLAKRDAEWVGKVHKFLGLSVGCIQQDMNIHERKEQYKCDITYSYTSHLGWDYLRDILANDPKERVMRWPKPFHYALIDEIDSVLIDEGRNPLLISKVDIDGASELAKNIISAASIAASLVKCNKNKIMFTSEHRYKTVELTELGVQHAASLLDQYWGKPESVDFWHRKYASYILNALKAEVHYIRDKDYIIVGNGDFSEIKILDEVSGRAVDKKWSDGIHQAVEAKEYLKGSTGIQFTPLQEHAARVPWQALVGMYPKRSGMTGTAKTEEQEFIEVLGMPVVVVPTNKPCKRRDEPVSVYASKERKWSAVVEEAYEMYLRGRPVLIGTTSVSDSQDLSDRLRGVVKHSVLNAKPENAAREAEIVAQAGRKSTVTIATNMAGRGTDILLGGNPEMLAKGFILNALQPYLEGSGEQEDLFQRMTLSEMTSKAMKAAIDLFRIEGDFPKISISEAQELVQKISDSASLLSDHELEKMRHQFQKEEEEELLQYEDELQQDSMLFLAHEGGEQKPQNGGFREASPRLLRTLERRLRLAHGYALRDCQLSCKRESEVVKSRGGLHVIGTELQASRRIDNQLRGRAARQGDPGSTKFIISLEDNIFVENLGKSLISLTHRLMDDDMGVTSAALTHQLYGIQMDVDTHFQRWRKEQSFFETIREGHRLHVCGLRQHLLEASEEEIVSLMKQYIQAEIDEQIAVFCNPSKSLAKWQLAELLERINSLILKNEDSDGGLLCDWKEEVLRQSLVANKDLRFSMEHEYNEKNYHESNQQWEKIAESSSSMKGPNVREYLLLRKWLGAEAMHFYQKILDNGNGRRERQRKIGLDEVDGMWRRHLVIMERLQSGVRVRAYASIEPLEEYRIETTKAFGAMLRRSLHRTTQRLLNQHLEE